MDEVLMHFRDCLHVWSKDLGVLRQVDEESITGPSPLDLHNLKGCPPQQVLQH